MRRGEGGAERGGWKGGEITGVVDASEQFWCLYIV